MTHWESGKKVLQLSSDIGGRNNSGAMWGLYHYRIMPTRKHMYCMSEDVDIDYYLHVFHYFSNCILLSSLCGFVSKAIAYQ